MGRRRFALVLLRLDWLILGLLILRLLILRHMLLLLGRLLLLLRLKWLGHGDEDLDTTSAGY